MSQFRTVLFSLVLCAANGILLAESPIAADGAASLEKLIADLDGNAFRTREEASRKLREAGRDAVPLLVEAARSRSLESAVRAVAILEEIYTGEDDAAAADVEEALDLLIASDNLSAATRANEVVEQNYELREKRAVARIEELGGVVERSTDQIAVVVGGGRVIQQNAANGAGVLDSVRLDENWKGGAEGLKQIKRLARLRRLYVIKDVLTDEQKAEIAAALPNLDIQDRGRAYLGIGGSPGPRGQGCFVQTVKPDTAAAKAGLVQGDVIVEFGGKDVADFSTLIQLIAERKPGDKVPTKIVRGGVQAMDIEIVLGAWSDNEAVQQ